MIAREQQVIAVVDHHVEHRVMIGPAAATGAAGGFVHHDPCPAIGKPHRGGEPGKSRTDDVNCAQHQMKAWRMMIHNNRERGRRMGRRGDDQPRATQAVENQTIGLAHDARRAHGATGASHHDLVRLREVSACALDHARTNISEHGTIQHRLWIVRHDTGLAQGLRRQIKPSKHRVLVEIAQRYW